MLLTGEIARSSLVVHAVVVACSLLVLRALRALVAGLRGSLDRYEQRIDQLGIDLPPSPGTLIRTWFVRHQLSHAVLLPASPGVNRSRSESLFSCGVETEGMDYVVLSPLI